MTRQYAPRRLIPLLTSQLLLYGLVFQAAGQSVILLQEDASRCTVFRAISAQVPPDCQSRFRSIVLQLPSAPVPAPALAYVPPPQAPAPAPSDRIYAFAARIQFAFDSAQLISEAYPLLDTLAAVLKDPYMADKVVRIEGHTDITGSDEYNLLLSHRRAVAVQRYLREHHGLLSERLPVIGKGESELYDPSQPTEAVNRRVQFVNVSDSGGRR